MGGNRGQPAPELAVMAVTHRPKQVLVLHHHAHHFSCALRQLLLTLGELGRSPSGQEEVGGHHCGNIPQGHLVVLFLGCHLPEEFQERLGKGTEPASNSSTALGFPPSTVLALLPWAGRGSSQLPPIYDLCSRPSSLLLTQVCQFTDGKAAARPHRKFYCWTHLAEQESGLENVPRVT